MTEAVVATMCRDGDSADMVANTCGRAIPGMEARIARPDGDPEDGEGELLLRGEYVMLGYLDDPEATREAIDEDGWLHTGDVGTLDDDGNLTITDRLKDMYISGGFNVYPAEVEQALMRLEGVNDVAVVGVPDERMGEVGKAYVVRGDTGLSEDDVIAFAKERLANFKVPRQVEFVDVLPRNLGGKVLKTDLRRSGTGGRNEPRPVRSPSSPSRPRPESGLRPTCRTSRCPRWTPRRASPPTRSGRRSWPRRGGRWSAGRRSTTAAAPRWWSG